MVLFKLNSLNKEIDRVYNAHYKDCKHQEVHDFYRATVKRFRTAYQKDHVRVTPIICCRECKNWKPDGSKATRNFGGPLERYGACEICSGGRLESDFCSYGRIREVGE